ncbi:MAG: transposase [Amphritea sp.]
MGVGNASALRKGRFSEEGRIYLVTFVTEGRSPWFNSFELGRIIVSVMKNKSQFAETLAFVVMPDHVHWLVQLDKKPLNQTVHDVKSISAHRINSMQGRSGRFWQDGFHDHAVRKYEVVGGAPPRRKKAQHRRSLIMRSEIIPCGMLFGFRRSIE